MPLIPPRQRSSLRVKKYKPMEAICIKFFEIEFLSNKEFGFIFTAIFALAACYLFFNGLINWGYLLAAFSVVLFFITFWKADTLTAFNKLWLAPIITVMLNLSGSLILAQGSVVAPFIYTLF